MSALNDIRRALTDAYGTGIVLRDETADDLIKAAVAEFDMDAQAYPGELAMLRGLVRTLRVAARWGCIAEVQKLLYEHAADEADATPDFFQPGRTYSEVGDITDWRFRCDSITTHPDHGERTALGWRHFRGEWEPYAYGEDDWEIHQIADALTTRKDGR